MSANLEDIRTEYGGTPLDISNVDASPFIQFEKWLEQAQRAKLKEPTAMVLSTVGPDGMPSSRTVLLKGFGSDGFVFYTNYNSRKAVELGSNPRASVLFPWYELHRQVKVQGTVEKVTNAESLKYFLTRPFGSQISAWISDQSEVVSSRSFLEKKWNEMKSKFQEGKVPLPDAWGGFRLKPIFFEFWQGQKSRLHDRIKYSLKENGDWVTERLAP